MKIKLKNPKMRKIIKMRILKKKKRKKRTQCIKKIKYILQSYSLGDCRGSINVVCWSFGLQLQQTTIISKCLGSSN
jgi:hypothetical protein